MAAPCMAMAMTLQSVVGVVRSWPACEQQEITTATYDYRL